ncbi:hypothetical protein K525DRAFT_277089 [Schizophyllum commune Loenen D]|nr:hypothetical protein K525DRAFT_277089 [Schizophyllum commune Loenen D]
MAPRDLPGTRRALDTASSTRTATTSHAPPPAPVSDLFVDPMMGCPLAMYVDKDVPDQAEIQRLIVEHGGNVSLGYSAVPYILINPRTESGQRLWRQWAHKTNKKIILDARWVRECIKAGELQTRRTEWAGCKVQGNEWDEDGCDPPAQAPPDTAVPPEPIPPAPSAPADAAATASYMPEPTASTLASLASTSVAHAPLASTSTAHVLPHDTTTERHDQATQASLQYVPEYSGYAYDTMGNYHAMSSVYSYAPAPRWGTTTQQVAADSVLHYGHVEQAHTQVDQTHAHAMAMTDSQPLRAQYRQQDAWYPHAYSQQQTEYDYTRVQQQYAYYDNTMAYEQQQQAYAAPYPQHPHQPQDTLSAAMPVTPQLPPAPEPMVVDSPTKDPSTEDASEPSASEQTPPPHTQPSLAPPPPLRGRRSRRTGPLDASVLVARSNPPPRSPTPPSRVQISRFGGHAFTDEDKEYLDRYIQYCQDAGIMLSLREICERVALKAPHHTFYSWRRYCNKHKKRLGGYKMSHCLSPSPEEEDEEEEEGEGENEGEGEMDTTGYNGYEAQYYGEYGEQGMEMQGQDSGLHQHPHPVASTSSHTLETSTQAQSGQPQGHSGQSQNPDPSPSSDEETDGPVQDDIPSRSPSPPRALFRSTTGKGVAFTDADVTFLVRTLAYRRAQGRKMDGEFWRDICEKAPHHSRASWMKYWRRHRHELDPELQNAVPEVEMEAPEGMYGGASTSAAASDNVEGNNLPGASGRTSADAATMATTSNALNTTPANSATSTGGSSTRQQRSAPEVSYTSPSAAPPYTTTPAFAVGYGPQSQYASTSTAAYASASTAAPSYGAEYAQRPSTGYSTSSSAEYASRPSTGYATAGSSTGYAAPSAGYAADPTRPTTGYATTSASAGYASTSAPYASYGQDYTMSSSFTPAGIGQGYPSLEGRQYMSPSSSPETRYTASSSPVAHTTSPPVPSGPSPSATHPTATASAASQAQAPARSQASSSRPANAFSSASQPQAATAPPQSKPTQSSLPKSSSSRLPPTPSTTHPTKPPTGKPKRYTQADDVLLAKFLANKPRGTSDAIFRAFAGMHPHHPWKGWQEHYRVSRATVDHLVRQLQAGRAIGEGEEGG